jgi:hypothetical protein
VVLKRKCVASRGGDQAATCWQNDVELEGKNNIKTVVADDRGTIQLATDQPII